MIMELSPSPIPYHHISRALGQNSGLQVKELQNVHSHWEYLEKLKMKRGDKYKDTRGIWSLWHLHLQETLNTPTARQVTINPHTEGLFTLALITQNNLASFQ